ncbi:LOW QUALITY PROTEIN: junction-mediating and -regulatory protein-like [Polyodon spathula]|uniref:LOW QUALITY PROTEIN: junction-mediating and -regulatory protein-like n=1 Tax=Polyodon spathula TaxID=7913 RepID=UPI001B7DD9C7|nr:LOW QUALITY PROTEIN: junction-mediating and -regulatory protein-like [Polyodon spathula]
MSFTMEDTLESGWVAVRPNVFEEKEKHKFVFIVAWNEVEGKFAITCHNRTVQRQRSAGRHPAAAAGVRVEDPASSTAAVKRAGDDKHKSVRSTEKVRGRKAGAGDGISRGEDGHREVKGESGTKTPVQRKATVASSQIKTVQACSGSKVRGMSPPRLLDIEILDPSVIKDGSGTAEGKSTESEDLESVVTEDCSWAGLFSFSDLRAIHQQLCSVSSDLEPCLPLFPEEPSGVWTVLFAPPQATPKETETLCYQLQVYLGHALDTCGWKILSEILFAESDDPEEYYESLSELRQKGYEEVLQRAKKRLHELLEKHKTTESMVDLLDIYASEDEAYNSLVEATTELYQYLLQPFRDMRELAMLRRQQIKISMQNDYLGPRRIESLKKEDADWQRKAHMAVLSIQDLTVKYFEITARAQKAVSDRMRVDQKKFGKAAWAAAVERMEKLQYAVSKETLQLMRGKEICLEQRKHALREEMQNLQGGDEAMARLDQLESSYYDMQLQLYEIQGEILKCEELLLTTQLESIKRQMIERQDEVVYYDTYESIDAMQDTEHMAVSIHPQKEDLLKLQQKSRQLEARRGRISAKKAYLRNKKEICIVNHREKMCQRQGSQEDYTSHHAMQLQEEDEKKNIWVSQERQRTLDRLRSFKQRYPGQVILKSTRLRLARRKSSSPSVPYASPDQALSLTASVQTDETAEQREAGLPQAPSTTQQAVGLESVSLPPASTTFQPTQLASLPLSLPLERGLTLLTCPATALHPRAPSSTPPPPPPCPSEDPLSESEAQPGSPVRQPGELVTETPQASSALPSAQLFDSSQLVSARKKLKKTSAMEGSQKRRTSSPMDEVLASLKRGSFHLRKMEQRAMPPSPEEDDSNNILAQIRKGVLLKKVQREDLQDSLGELPDSADPLTRSIHEALRRIKEASPDSDSEDEGLPHADWDS